MAENAEAWAYIEEAAPFAFNGMGGADFGVFRRLMDRDDVPRWLERELMGKFSAWVGAVRRDAERRKSK